MLIKRKQFIQTGSLATASLMVPKFLRAFEGGPPVPKGNKVVVILQLSGGNDGLNTVIPFRNDLYYKSRPRLGIERSKALTLTEETGLHPALTGFRELYDDGSLAILNNVGYPNPDRSHESQETSPRPDRAHLGSFVWVDHGALVHLRHQRR